MRRPRTDILNGFTGLLFVLSLPLVGRRIGAVYVVHMALNLWLPLSSGVFEGVGRYCAVLFPFFFVMATVRPFIVRKGMLAVSAALYTLCMTLWVKRRSQKGRLFLAASEVRWTAPPKTRRPVPCARRQPVGCRDLRSARGDPQATAHVLHSGGRKFARAYAAGVAHLPDAGGPTCAGTATV